MSDINFSESKSKRGEVLRELVPRNGKLKLHRYSLDQLRSAPAYRFFFRCCDDNKVKMARKPGKKQKENPVGCTGK